MGAGASAAMADAELAAQTAKKELRRMSLAFHAAISEDSEHEVRRALAAVRQVKFGGQCLVRWLGLPDIAH